MSAARWSSEESREQTTRPLSQPQFRYFRPFRIFLKIWTQRLICTPPLSTLHSSARLVMQPAMGGENGVRETCGSSKQSWCSYYVNKSKIFFTATDTDTDKEEKRKQFEFGNFLSTIILTVENFRLVSRAPKTLLGWRRICRREERILLRRFSGPNDGMTWSL